MTKQKLRLPLVIGLVLLVVALFFARQYFSSKSSSSAFDTAIWQTDISKRNAMAYPVHVGMNKAEVLELLGKPDFEASKGVEWSTTYVYKVPLDSVKAVRVIDFKNEVVDRLGFDDSGEEYYQDTKVETKH